MVIALSMVIALRLCKNHAEQLWLYCWFPLRCRLGGACALASGLSLFLAACASGYGAASSDALKVPGAIELNNGPTSDVPLGGAGTGTVYLHGQVYRFAIGGEGVDGSAVAIIQTTGEAYRLDDIARLAGTYRRTTSAPVAGTQSGGLWLQNQNGIIIHLRPPTGGRMPDIGDDAVSIVFEQ
jgi:hypothetical protein